MHSQIKKVVEALELLPQEWRVVPTFGKRPLGNSWQKINYSPEELRNKLIFNQMKINLKYKTVVPTGVAVVCGEYPQGNLIAVDCDGPLGWNKILEFAGSQVFSDKPAQVMKQALQYLPLTVAFTSGREFRAQFLYVIPETTPVKSIKLEHLELRANNLASVLPPSFHPDGKKYRWLTGCSPQQTSVAQAPDWVIKHMHNQYLCSIKRNTSRESRYSQNLFMKNWEFTETPLTTINFNQPSCATNNLFQEPAKVSQIKTRTSFDTNIKAALTFLSVLHPSYADDYSTWVQIGMALKSVNPSLLEVWDSWSKLSSKYKPGECAYKWQSFRREGITIRTLAKYAINS
ncbi:MAG: bifunctional DNA primase/polymerase [Scytonematopsis contorta HA4267-MV1]|nr:bifunctional DNA primase/polymerase [Scytonematopsis contorta HA4267-MV1]